MIVLEIIQKVHNEREKNIENGVLEPTNIEDLGREDDLLKIVVFIIYC